MAETGPSEHREREHFFGAAKMMAGLTLLSRVAGMIRASAIASLGATVLTDAFGLAYVIPNMFRLLFAEGAMTSAFVPVFTQVLDRPQGGIDEARKLLANAMGLLAAVVLVLMLVVQGALLAWNWWFPGSLDRELLVWLTALMMPFMVTVCLLAMGSAALNCRGHFAYPTAAPILMNMIIAAGAWWIAPAVARDTVGRLMVVADSVAVSGVAQLIALPRLLKRHGLSSRMTLRPLHPDIRPMVKLMVPMLIVFGFQQFTELLQMGMAWILRAKFPGDMLHVWGWSVAKPLEAGVVVRLTAARFLNQFPQGVLAISLGVAVFPLLSRYASRGDMPNLRDSLNRALRLAIMEGLATGVGLLVLAEPITWLIYRHGDFTAADVRQSAFILQSYVVGMWAYCARQIVVRAFYAVKDARTPLRVSCWMYVLGFALAAGLVWVPGVGAAAFGLATAVTFSLGTVWQAWLLRQRWGRIGGRKLAASVTRLAVACAAMAAGVLALRYGVLAGRGHGLVVVVCVPAGAAIFLAVAAALRAPELGELFGALRTRKDKGKNGRKDAENAEGRKE